MFIPKNIQPPSIPKIRELTLTEIKNVAGGGGRSSGITVKSKSYKPKHSNQLTPAYPARRG